MSPARGDGDGHTVSRYFQAFVLWRLSLAVCSASSESQSSNGRNSPSVTERRDCGPFPTDVLASLTLFLLVLFNPAVSRAVRLTPGIPALTSRAGTFLSFVFLTPPAAPTHSEAPALILGARVPGSRSQSALLRVPVRKSAHSPVQVATPSRRPNAAAPSPFRLFSKICAGFPAPRFVPQYSVLEMFICRNPDVSSCVSG